MTRMLLRKTRLKCCVALSRRNISIGFLLSIVWISVIAIYRTNRTLIFPKVYSIFPWNTPIYMSDFVDDEMEHEPLKGECEFPNMDSFDPTLNELLKTYPPLDCSDGTPHLVHVDNFVIKINRTKQKQGLQPRGRLKNCRYKEIYRVAGSDKKVYFGHWSPFFTDRIEVDPEHQNIVVECYWFNKTVMSRSYFALVRVDMDTETYLNKNYEKHKRQNSPAETLSILMIGIDGMSKQNFERTMPKTRNYLVNNLGALELFKYNKVGYSTLPNVTPLLTGKTWEEIGEHLNFKKGFLDPVNHFFLWSEARALGYRTGMVLDNRHITSFHYQRRGFYKAPVDYYLRPTLLAWGSDKLMHGPDKNCVGDKPIVSQLYDYWLQLARTFRSKTTPYFGYSHAATLTHDDCNEASKGDNVYHKFLQDLVATGALNNTVIVWFSDHGQRFGKIRLTFQGRVETNTPYLFFIFPPWFKKKYSDVMSVLEINQNRLTTHFDVYETIRDLLYFQGKTGNGTVNQRGISLFKEIPRERTCAQAGVPEEFCACAHFSQPVLSTKILNELSSALLARINSFTEEIREMCTRLSLNFINNVLLMDTNALETMHFKSFRVIITVKPGSGMFEGLVQLNKKTGRVTAVGEVVRTNLYRGQADCVVDATLRQFCFCTQKRLA